MTGRSRKDHHPVVPKNHIPLPTFGIDEAVQVLVNGGGGGEEHSLWIAMQKCRYFQTRIVILGPKTCDVKLARWCDDVTPITFG
jgi:hypothetical protein